MFAWFNQVRNESKVVKNPPTTNKELIKVFERVWIAETVDNVYGAAKELSDDDYIKYHEWEIVNSERMYVKYLPKHIVFRGIQPNIIFHGGCIGCTMQQLHGINVCKGCSYFKFDQGLPDLSNDTDR